MKKKIISLVCQLAIILCAHFLVWGDTILILGITGIIAQCVFSLKIVGWVSAIAYPITYWVVGLFDTPMDGNQYVYWYWGYIVLVVISLVIDLIVKKKQTNQFQFDKGV